MCQVDSTTLLSAYVRGWFPMTDQDGVVRFYECDPRGVIPLEPADAFHVPRTLGQVIRQGQFQIRIDTCFEQTVRACMQSRPSTWISEELVRAYLQLHADGHAHSVEAWQGNELAGGLFGVALGGAFLGESMFHRQPNASKVALVSLVERLRARGFQLLDAQQASDHLRQFGCITIPLEAYLGQLRAAIAKRCVFGERK